MALRTVATLLLVGLAAQAEEASLTPPEALELPAIPYPAEAPRLEAPGRVTVTLYIDVDGQVRASELVEGVGEPFDSAVLRGVIAFRFSPAKWQGAPVEVAVPFTHTFVPPPPPESEVDATLVSEIEGLVQERGTRQPVSSATIVIRVDDRELLATTDAEGKFVVKVPAGALEVRISSSFHRRFLQQETVDPKQRLKVKYLVDRQSYSPYESVVVGKRERTEVSRTTLEGRELKQVPGTFGDPFKVVTVLPGVTSVMSLLPLPVVRGSSPGNTGFFLDQARLPLLFHLLGGPSVVHPEFIERVDFYPGGFPVKYGGYTGGIIDGQTRAAKADESRLELDLNLVQSGVFWRTGLPEHELTATLAGRYGYPGGLLSLVVPELTFSYWDYQVLVDQGSAYDGWTAFLYGASDLLEAAEEKDPVTGELIFERQLLFRFHRGDFRFRKGGEDAHWQARMLVGWDESGLGPSVTTNTLLLSPMLRGEVKLAESLRLSGGYDLQVRKNGSVTDGETIGDGAGALPESGWNIVNGLFAELQWRPSERLLVVPGVRGDWYEQKGDRRLNVDPRLMARYRVDDDGTWLKGSAGVFHQPARLFVPVPGLDLTPLDLPLLASFQSSVGAEMKLSPGIELDVQTYFNWMDPVLFDLEVNQNPDDLIGEGPGSFPGMPGETPDRPNREEELISRLFAPRQGRSFGLEVMLRKRDSDNLFGWISYTLSHSQRNGGSGWTAFDFDRTHILNLVAGLKLPRNWEVGTRVLVQTGTPMTTLFGYNAARSDPQLRVDLRIDKRAVWNDWLLDFYVDVINVVVGAESGGITGSQPLRYVLPTVGFRAVL